MLNFVPPLFTMRPETLKRCLSYQKDHQEQQTRPCHGHKLELQVCYSGPSSLEVQGTFPCILPLYDDWYSPLYGKKNCVAKESNAPCVIDIGID